MAVYVFTISTDFVAAGGVVDTARLSHEAKAALGAFPRTVTVSGDTCGIDYDPDLTSGQQTTLAGVVAAHANANVRLEPRHLEQDFDGQGRLLRETWYARKVGSVLSMKVTERLLSYQSQMLWSETETVFYANGTAASAKTRQYKADKSGSNTLIRREES